MLKNLITKDFLSYLSNVKTVRYLLHQLIRFFVDHLFQFFLSQATVEGSIK